MIKNSVNYGVYLLGCIDGSNFNDITHNILLYNGEGGNSQAYDDGIGNEWYNSTTSEGNYWGDYIGVGSYYIDGTANSEDMFPLVETD